MTDPMWRSTKLKKYRFRVEFKNECYYGLLNAIKGIRFVTNFSEGKYIN